MSRCGCVSNPVAGLRRCRRCSPAAARGGCCPGRSGRRTRTNAGIVSQDVVVTARSPARRSSTVADMSFRVVRVSSSCACRSAASSSPSVSPAERPRWISIWYSGWPSCPKIGRTTNSVDGSSVSSVSVTDCSVTIVISVVSWRVTCAVGCSDASTPGQPVVQRLVGVVEPPGAVAAGADIGEHPLMLRDLGAGQPRHDPLQPGRDEIVVAPGHRDQPERRIDGEALARPRARRRCRGRPCRRWSGAGRRSSTSSSPRRACRAGSPARRARGPAAGTASAGRAPVRTTRCPAQKRRSSRRVTHAPRSSSASTRAQVEVLIPQIFASSADVRPPGESASAPSTSITRPVGGDLAVDAADAQLPTHPSKI